VDVFVHNALDFVIFGTVSTSGVMSLEHEIDVSVSDGH
jgi:hypothetical protein